MSKRIYSVPKRVHHKHAQRRTARYSKRDVITYQDEIHQFILKRTGINKKRDFKFKERNRTYINSNAVYH